MGGEVVQLNGQYRVNGTLAVTRALGDADFKDCVIADPEILEIERSDLKEEYVVLGSDGLWDYMSVKELGEFVNQLIIDNQASNVAQELAKKAKAKGATDNICVIVVFLESLDTLAIKIKERKDQKVVVYEGLLGKFLVILIF
jgi:serine/threonine protein phosphatase PrpC